MKLRTLILFALLAIGLPIVATAETSLTSSDTTGMDWSRVPEYRIVPGDRLQLDFGRRTDGGQDVRDAKVRPDGRITVFPAGDVVAAGLTLLGVRARQLALRRRTKPTSSAIPANKESEASGSGRATTSTRG